MSPNQDSCSDELAFSEGQLIKVFGDQDADGFLYGELNGSTGYIPCNMVSEVDDPDVANRISNENQLDVKNVKSSHQNVRKASGSGPSSSSKTAKNTSKSSSSRHSNQMPVKEQSFQPITTPKTREKKQTMVALYDYDPQSLSPNPDVDVIIYLFIFFL
jgi:peripheral-type benzodiazepine receptor-associated protein 1